jgi:hypothetical protein
MELLMYKTSITLLIERDPDADHDGISTGNLCETAETPAEEHEFIISSEKPLELADIIKLLGLDEDDDLSTSYQAHNLSIPQSNT